MKINSRNIFKTTAIAGTCVAPAGYMVYKHVEMYPKEQKTQRLDIANRVGGFFTGMVPGLYMVHKYAKTNLKGKNLAFRLLGTALTAIGSVVGLKLAKVFNNNFLHKNENNDSSKYFKMIG